MKCTALLPLALAAGCASLDDADYPSLAPRPIETRSEEIARPASAPVASADGPLVARLDALARALDGAERDFDAGLEDVERRVTAARRSPVGDDRWVEAQTALSGLQATGFETSGILADLDALVVEAIAREAGGLDAIVSLRERAAAQAASQTSRLAALGERLER